MGERRRFGCSWAAWVTALTLPVLTFSAVLAPAVSVRAAELDVEAQLSVPGTKLLVVEFFATWCGPCMAAVPRWEALRRQYAGKGLRFVVVSVKDDRELCQDVPWRPDVLLCDEEGTLAKRFGVEKLPAAFLWTWQGNLLEEKLHVDEVERRIEGWMAELPRVEVEVKDHGRHVGLDAERLGRLIEQELSRQGKLTVVTSPAERARLRTKAKASLAYSADEATACAIGQEVSPNSILEVSVTPGRDKQLRLGLVSIESHCRTRDIAEAWDPRQPARSVDRAVTALMSRLKHPEPQLPALARAPMSRPPPSLSSAEPAFSNQRNPAADPYEDLARRAAEAKAQAERDAAALEAAKKSRAERLERAWTAVSAAATTKALPARERLGALAQFLVDFPADNPHRDEAERYIGLLKAGKEPNAAPEGMVEVPAGRFFMGCNEKVDNECDGDEKPGKTVDLPTFFIDRTEVTVEQYAVCVRAGRCKEPNTGGSCTWKAAGKGNHPVNCVDWERARTYCAWAGKRLPKESEWEKAARGTDGRKYPWGNAGFGRTPVANIADETGKRENSGWTIAEGYDDGYVATSPVGNYPAGASPYGALDMSGNVWEWVEDWYESGKTRSVRGGSWRFGPRLARASHRDNYGPSDRDDLLGLRCAHSPPS